MGKMNRFKESLRGMDDSRLELKAKNITMILAKTGANPKREHLQQREAIFEEFKRRGKLYIYQRAWKAAAEEGLKKD